MWNKYIDIKLFSVFSLSLVFFTFAFCALTLLFQKPVNAFAPTFGLAAAVIAAYFTSKDWLKTLCTAVLNIILILIIFLLRKDTFDMNIDNYFYGFNAIQLLRKGWLAYNFDYAYPPLHRWAIHFPKASWIIDVSMIKLFNHFGSIMVLNTYVLISTFPWCYLAFRALNVDKLYSFLLTFALIMSPSLFAVHLPVKPDALMFCMLFILISSMILYYKENKKIWLYGVFLSFSLMINFKLNGFFLGGMYGTFFLAYLLYKKEFIKVRNLIITALCCAVVSITALGFNPFMTNLKAKNDPFYPLLVKDAIIGSVSSVFEESSNRFEKFYISMFSEFDGSVIKKDHKIYHVMKFPFSVHKRELQQGRTGLPLLGGWGIFFSGIFILCFIALIPLRKTKDYKLFLLVLAAILFSVFINPEAWWARFSIHLYLFPVVIIYYALQNNKKLVANILLSLVLFNALFMNTLVSYKTYKHQKKLMEIMNMYKFYGQVVISAHRTTIESIKINFDNHGVKYIAVDGKDFKCPKHLLKNFIFTYVCLSPTREFVKEKYEKEHLH